MNLLKIAALGLFIGLAVGPAFRAITAGSNSSGGGVHQCPCGPACGCDNCECGDKR